MIVAAAACRRRLPACRSCGPIHPALGGPSVAIRPLGAGDQQAVPERAHGRHLVRVVGDAAQDGVVGQVVLHGLLVQVDPGRPVPRPRACPRHRRRGPGSGGARLSRRARRRPAATARWRGRSGRSGPATGRGYWRTSDCRAPSLGPPHSSPGRRPPRPACPGRRPCRCRRRRRGPSASAARNLARARWGWCSAVRVNP